MVIQSQAVSQVRAHLALAGIPCGRIPDQLCALLWAEYSPREWVIVAEGVWAGLSAPAAFARVDNCESERIRLG